MGHFDSYADVTLPTVPRKRNVTHAVKHRRSRKRYGWRKLKKIETADCFYRVNSEHIGGPFSSSLGGLFKMLYILLGKHPSLIRGRNFRVTNKRLLGIDQFLSSVLIDYNNNKQNRAKNFDLEFSKTKPEKLGSIHSAPLLVKNNEIVISFHVN